MRPVPESLVNSFSSIPTERSRHSTASEPPVAIAISGMSPSLLFLRQAGLVLVGQRGRRAGGDVGHRDLAAPLAGLHDDRDVRARRDVLQREAPLRVGQRDRDRLAGDVGVALVAGRARGDRRRRRVRNVDQDVVERVLAGGIVDDAGQRRLRRRRAGVLHDLALQAAAGGAAAARADVVRRAGRRRPGRWPGSRAPCRSRCRSARSTGRRPSGCT